MERTMIDPKRSADCLSYRDALIQDCSMNDDITFVEEAERALVEGSFRKALKLSNQYLKRHATTTKFKTLRSLDNKNTTSVDNVYLNLSTKVSFPQFEQTAGVRNVTIDLRTSEDKSLGNLAKTQCSCVDRMGAVALQSWFEIWKKKQQQQQQHQTPIQTLEAFRHLEPFLNVFTFDENKKSKSNSAMSLSLAVIFVQFSFAIGNIDNSIEMAAELLYRLLILPEKSPNRLSRQQQEECQLLMDTLFTRWLPTVVMNDGNNKSTVLDNLWLRMTSRIGDETTWIPLDQPVSVYVIANKPQHKSIRSILSFLETTFPGRFPTAHSRYSNVIDEYRRSLTKLLEKSERDEWDAAILETTNQHQHRTSSPIISRHNKNRQLVPKPTAMGKIKTAVEKLLFHWKNIVHQHFLSPIWRGQPEERIRVVLALFTAWIAWRNRRKLISSVKRGSTIFLLQPLQEIVQALVGE